MTSYFVKLKGQSFRRSMLVGEIGKKIMIKLPVCLFVAICRTGINLADLATCNSCFPIFDLVFSK